MPHFVILNAVKNLVLHRDASPFLRVCVAEGKVLFG
ncbi:MAG: hypothetical protein QOH93_123 [Chloroflexia bacterium]|jgi:hypothetical protein|nr:hypothetical protein [Chloroflexia bacterium]